MSQLPFEPKTLGDIKTRLHELYDKTDDVPGYSDRLRGEVFELIVKALDIIPFDPLGRDYVTEAVSVLEKGNARLALAKLKFALDSYIA